MFVAFKKLPEHARVWIYQADRTMTSDEVSSIKSESKHFLENWSAHGQGLLSSADVFYNRFLVIGVDEDTAAASGCSIDASVHFVQQLGTSMQIDFFNRQIVCWLDGESIHESELGSLKNAIRSGQLGPSTRVFDNLVPDIRAFRENWIKPAEQTWLTRYFTKEEADI